MEEKLVKGIYFQEYVRMIKKLKDVDWKKHLEEEDFEIMAQLILPSQWYPIDSYARFGLAIFKELAKGDLNASKLWGRTSIEQILEIYKNLICEGNPVQSFDKYLVLQKRFMNFDVFEAVLSKDKIIQIKIALAFAQDAHAPFAYQLFGSFERLLELSGAQNLQGRFMVEGWKQNKSTIIEFTWD